MARLVTLTELKVAMGIADSNTTRDAQLGEAIEDASQAILSYTDRDFGTEEDDGDRQYEYDGSGFLDIDDASEITQVILSVGSYTHTLPDEEWTAQPFGGPIYSFLTLPQGSLFSSPAMGFKSNLDRYEPRPLDPTIVTVTGTWGYPEVPDDVKRAVIWTAAAFVQNPEAHASESVADYSWSAGGGGFEAQEAIPRRAKELLAPYVRPFT